MIQKILNTVRSPVGRLAGSFVGVGAVCALFVHAGVQSVFSILVKTAPFFPWILICEAGVLACSMRALRTLYGKDRNSIPTEEWFRVGLIGYSLNAVVPAGRAVAEATRAALLAPYTSKSRATFAAIHSQATALLANAMISLLATFSLYRVVGFSVPTLAIAGNFAVTAIGGVGILLASRKFSRRGEELLLKGDLVTAFGWEFLGRLTQVLQNGILVAAVGGSFGLLPAFCSEALHLVGATAGELIPAQLGATELSYQLSAKALGVHPVDALSIALLAHTAQLIWVGVGVLTPILWRSRLQNSYVSNSSS